MAWVRALWIAGPFLFAACSLLAPSDEALSSRFGETDRVTDAGDAGDTSDATTSGPDADANPEACTCEPDHAVGSCDTGVCQIDHCETGYLDVDRNDENGCELTSPIPTDGLVLWLAADEGLEESGGKVTAWRDRSSKRYDHTQPNSSVQPTVLATKLNGRPVVDFQKQRLENGDFSDTFAEGVSLFAVVERDTSTGPPYEYGAVLDLFDNERTNGLYFARYGGGNDFLAGYANVSGLLYTTGNQFAPDVPHLVALTLGPTGDLTLRWDGQEPPVVVTNFTPTPLFLERSYIGGNSSTLEFHDGYIAEIILYDRAITEGQAVEQYLTVKWGCCPDPG